MRNVLFLVALTVCGSALADEMADANQALAAKAYPEALQTFSKLAAAGNPAAQLRLGEMFWYGEGVAIDRPRADALFASAAKAGNTEARAAQSLSAQRTARAAEIAYWTRTYDGADLTAGQFHCATPDIPAVSKSTGSIRATKAALAAWRVCYERFANNVNDALPAGKRVPADVAIVMSEQETAQARAHLATVYAGVMASARATLETLGQRRNDWSDATELLVMQQRGVNKARYAQYNADLQRLQRQRESDMMEDRTAPQIRRN